MQMDFNSGSQETFSQSLFRYGSGSIPSSNEGNMMNNANSDYWSQSSNSQQQPEEALPSYTMRPYLFADGNKNVFHPPRGKQFSKSFRNFYESRKKNSAETQKKDVLENLIALLKECSKDIKVTVDSVKTELRESLKENIDTLKTVQIGESDKILNTVKNEVQSLSNSEKEQSLLSELKEKLAKKCEEAHAQCGQIACLEDQVQSLKKRLQVFESKERQYFTELEEKLSRIIGQCSDNAQSLLTTKNMNTDANAKLSALSTDLRLVLHQFHSAPTNQPFRNENGCNNMSAYQQYPGGVYNTKHVTYAPSNPHPPFSQCSMDSRNMANLPPYISKPLSHYSPLHSLGKSLSNVARASPTAVVTPMVHKKVPVKQEETSPLSECPISKKTKECDVFVLSSDSESCQDISDMITSVLKTKSKKKSTKKQCNAVPKLSSSEICRPSPVQRSIRRYGKIKKNANKNVLEKLTLSKGSSNSHHQEERVRSEVTIDQLWKEVAETSHDVTIPPAKKYLKTSRGSLAMQRSQTNVFKFCDNDGDLAQLSHLLAKQKSRHTAPM